jgi:hypothetical protein
MKGTLEGNHPFLISCHGIENIWPPKEKDSIPEERCQQCGYVCRQLIEGAAVFS